MFNMLRSQVLVECIHVPLGYNMIEKFNYWCVLFFLLQTPR